jgi:hypothetical protein
MTRWTDRGERMPRAAWCTSCGTYAWICSDGGCEMGHSPSLVQGVYDTHPDPATGRPLAPTMSPIGVHEQAGGGGTVPAWYPDPSRRNELRYWDGGNWTQHVANGGRHSVETPPPPVASSGDAAQRMVVAAFILAVVFTLFGLNRASGKLVSTPWDTANLIRDVICAVGWTAVAIGLARHRPWAARAGTILGLALVVYSLAFIGQRPTDLALWTAAGAFALVFGAVALSMSRVQSELRGMSDKGRATTAFASPLAVRPKRRWVVAGILGSFGWFVLVVVVVYVVGMLGGQGAAVGYAGGRLILPGLLIVWIAATGWGLSAPKSR